MSEAAGVDRRLLVAHHHPGRLRVRSAALEREAPLREAVTRWLADQPGVSSVEPQAHTGSVLVLYDPSTARAADLLAGVAERAHLDIAETEPRALDPQAVFDAAHGLDDAVRDWSGGRYGLNLVVPFGLGLGSMASFLFSAHRRAPRWDNLLYWGVHFFVLFNEDARARRSDGGARHR